MEAQNTPLDAAGIEALAKKYELEPDFVGRLYERITDKQNIGRALRMFNDGTLKYADATGDKPLCIADIRSEVARNYLEMRRKALQKMDEYKRIADYYNACTSVTKRHESGHSDVVFLREGRIVGFGHWTPKNGGIYAADNEVMPKLNWRPHEHLARLRRMDRQFYKAVKREAYAEDPSLFRMDERTVRKAR